MIDIMPLTPSIELNLRYFNLENRLSAKSTASIYSISSIWDCSQIFESIAGGLCERILDTKALLLWALLCTVYFIVMCVIMHPTSLMDIAGVLCDWYLCTSWLLLVIKCLVLLQRPNNDHNHLYAILTMTLINIQSYRLLGFHVIDGTPQSPGNVLDCSRLYVLLFLWLSALRLTGVHHYLWSIDGIFPFSALFLSVSLAFLFRCLELSNINALRCTASVCFCTSNED